MCSIIPRTVLAFYPRLASHSVTNRGLLQYACIRRSRHSYYMPAVCDLYHVHDHSSALRPTRFLLQKDPVWCVVSPYHSFRLSVHPRSESTACIIPYGLYPANCVFCHRRSAGSRHAKSELGSRITRRKIPLFWPRLSVSTYIYTRLVGHLLTHAHTDPGSMGKAASLAHLSAFHGVPTWNEVMESHAMI
ncbi:hypothetical protein BOTBODRAFT_242672 [Botryobasidium botryosum FD-172 SS1]|uniref:Uncharacterized protein n=1 Tax=Botryobasidium botryosum (strain FD-172 SS1) TaxID=930990 RepID=A0A067LWP6_BOTB1|nr:hypothetical protein BOTBODRAFT_242672 [Botryobasidium botryosum FD-172 SS1]